MIVNNWLLQFLADICGLSVERPAYRETTVLGAAVLAGLGSGVYSSLEDVKAAWCLDFQATPKMTEVRRAELISGWQRAVERTKIRS